MATKKNAEFGVSVMNRLRALERQLGSVLQRIAVAETTIEASYRPLKEEIGELQEWRKRKIEEKDKPKVGGFVRIHPLYSWVCPGCGETNECPPGSVEEHAGMVKCEDCGIELKAER